MYSDFVVFAGHSAGTSHVINSAKIHEIIMHHNVNHFRIYYLFEAKKNIARHRIQMGACVLFYGVVFDDSNKNKWI